MTKKNPNLLLPQFPVLKDDQTTDNSEKLKKARQYIFGVPAAAFATYKISRYAYENRKDITWENFKKECTFYNVQKYSGLVNRVLDNFPNSEDTTLSAALRSVSFMNQISEDFGPSREEIMEKFAESKDLVAYDSMQIIPLILGTKLAKFFQHQEVMNFDDGDKVFCITTPQGEKLYYVAQKYSATGSDVMRISSDYIYTTKNFSLATIQEKFWELYPEGVYIHKGDVNHSYSNETAGAILRFENGLQVSDLPATKEITYFGRRNNEIEKTYENLKKYRDKGIQRNFLLVGPAGSGKTSFAILLAKRHTSKVFKIANDVLFQMEKFDLDLIFKLLNPEFVIADDFDRAHNSDAQRILHFLESMKNDHQNISMIATANDLESIDVACLRPGRFDEIKSFMPPTANERKEVLKKYIAHFKVELSDAEIDKLVVISKGYTHAYLREFVLHVMNDDLGSLVRRIKMLKNLQRNGNFMTFGESEIEDDDAAEATLVNDEDEDENPVLFGLQVEDNQFTSSFSDDDDCNVSNQARGKRGKGKKNFSSTKK